jgi:hypothetical protein
MWSSSYLISLFSFTRWWLVVPVLLTLNTMVLPDWISELSLRRLWLDRLGRLRWLCRHRGFSRFAFERGQLLLGGGLGRGRQSKKLSTSRRRGSRWFIADLAGHTEAADATSPVRRCSRRRLLSPTQLGRSL